MEIKQFNETGKGSFQAIEDGDTAGEMTYTWEGTDRFIIDHTNVSPEFEGKGIGKKLVLEAVDFARQKKVKIIPLCSFAKSVFERTENIQDVLYSSEL